ncbi:hypothetical protein GGTG_01869 [Gaeumannomyces tritici R3-111a-1]|uniref:Uncharacterized protein n=1 Tax=Gaeumannomyces tritici (strain R3-111a-1) TaxID=644352 RepID=J3NKS8_GAET3|nr:hypothetical protein GGTG_01869 [Gaeumannomyces tritici R3-111a-1]EJT81895.1 hypothetical protein GGTG_01869 [Gaeumannomyces tritici R3-111a-1]
MPSNLEVAVYLQPPHFADFPHPRIQSTRCHHRPTQVPKLHGGPAYQRVPADHQAERHTPLPPSNHLPTLPACIFAWLPKEPGHDAADPVDRPFLAFSSKGAKQQIRKSKNETGENQSR